jgi:hypothetical protein
LYHKLDNAPLSGLETRIRPLRPKRENPGFCYNTANQKTGANAVIITKRKMGILLALLGLALVLGALAVDLLGAGKWGGIGPAQRSAIIAGAIVCFFGLTLLPLGNRPA